LGCDFQERFINLGLDADAGISCTPIVAAAPTLTSIGIGSIISGENISIEVTEGGKWLISETHGGKLENLSTKESRKQSIRRKYPKTIFFDLQDILNPSELTVKDASLIVVFTQELDAGGHESGALRFPLELADQYIESLLDAVRQLRSLGVDEIHLISDHGFIILDDIRDADKISLPKDAEFAYVNHRCIVAKHIPKELGATFVIPNSDLLLCVPRKLGIYKAPGTNQFFHGGLSIQEVVIPHIKIEFTEAHLKYEARLQAPDVIHNLIFEVNIVRELPKGEVLAGAARFVEITGALVKDGIEIFHDSGPDLIVDQDNDMLAHRLRIKPATRFSYGDELRLELAGCGYTRTA